MSNKICSPVVVENPIFPAITSHAISYNYEAQKPANALESICCSSKEKSASCRVSSSNYVSPASASLNNYTQPIVSHTYHSFNGKELELQFEKLQCSADDHDAKETTQKTSKYSSALTLKAVKHQPLKKAVISRSNRLRRGTKSPNTSKFVLKPSKLNSCVKAAFNRSYSDFYRNGHSSDKIECKGEKELSVYHDFSTACSKELETIELASSINTENSLRPRSSSLPAAGSPVLEQPSSSSPPTKNALELSTRRSRRKHLSKGDQNQSNDRKNFSSSENKISTRANKRRKLPPETLSSSCAQQHTESSENEKAKVNDNLDASIDRLTDYLQESILLPKKMSFMAEMMYT